MMNNSVNNEPSSMDKEIDLLELGKKIWDKRKFILKISSIGLIVGLIIAFSIPKEYTTEVILVSESATQGSDAKMGTLAAIAGVNLNPENVGNIPPGLYPQIFQSTLFLQGLLNLNVKDHEENIDTTLYCYLEEKQKAAWWSIILGIPRGILGLLSSGEQPQMPQDANGNANPTPIYVSLKESLVINSLKNRISIDVNDKTGVITLGTTMQSPQVSAFVMDTLTSYLQSYLIDYRTQKARKNLVFTEKLYSEAKQSYFSVQAKYANYLDHNQNVILASHRVNQEKLQNEVALAYSVYNQMAQQLQMAKIKVQDETPVYMVVEPSIYPLVPSKPSKKLIVLGFIILAMFGSVGSVIVKDLFLNMKNKK